MNFKAYFVYIPQAILLGYLGIMQTFIGDNFFFKGSVLASVSLVLYSLAFLVIRGVMRNATVPPKRFGVLIIAASAVLISALLVVTLLTSNEGGVLLISVTVINVIISFICLFVTLSMSGGSVKETSKMGNTPQYNPSTGLPVYSGYIDVRGNPVGATVRNKNL